MRTLVLPVVWGFLVLLKFIFFASLAPPVACVVGNASSSKEFFALLGQSGIGTIYLYKDISLNLEDAPQYPVNLTASLTIAAGLPDPQVVSFKANYIASKVRLAPYVTLTFERIILSGILRGTGQHLDLLTRSDGGAVVYNRTINHRTACLPFKLFYDQLQSLPDPLPEAGVPVNVSVRKIWLRNSTLCWRDASARNVCMSPHLDVLAYGTYNQKIDGVIGNGGYNSFFVDSYGVCDVEISEDCIKQRGADLCLAAALALEKAATAESSPANNMPLAVGLGVGLGGALLLAVVLAAVFARFHWVHRRETALAATSSSSTRSKAAAGLASQGIVASDLEKASGDGVPPTVRKLTGGGPGAPGAASGSAADGDGAAGGDSKGLMTAPTTAGSTGVIGSTSSSNSSDGSSGVPIEASSVTVVQRIGASDGKGLGEVEAARMNLLANAARGRAGRGAPLDVKVLQLLGQGSFGKVYKGIWHGTLVALKAQVLPPSLSGDARRRHMAVMEAAISSAINHPSIVQTYCYSFRPIKDTVGRTVVKRAKKSSTIREDAEELDAGDGGCDEAGDGEVGHEEGGEDYGHELLLVLEYCDGGSLRAALDKGVFHQGRPWPWDWRRAIQAAGQAAAAEMGRQAARPPSQPHQQCKQHQGPAAAEPPPLQGDSTAISNLVAAMLRSNQSGQPASAPDSNPLKVSGPNTAGSSSAAASAAAPAAPRPDGVERRSGAPSRTVDASELGSSMWPRLDTYEPDFAHGAFEVVLPTADGKDAAATAAAASGDTSGDAATADGVGAVAAQAQAATTLDVFNTLAGAPTAATSFVSSFTNAFSASAADNAAAAAAADRLAMMYLLQQAAAAVAAGANPTVDGYAKMLADYISSSNVTGLNTSAMAAALVSSNGAAAAKPQAGTGPVSLSSDGTGTLVAPPPAVLAAAAAAAAPAAPAPPPPTAAARSSAAASGSSPLRSQASLRGPVSSGAGSMAAEGCGSASAAPPQPAIRYGLMLAVAADVASGLLHLHAHGVVHGDVKASNVLLKQIVVSDPLEAAGRAMDAMSYGAGGTAPPSAGPSLATAAVLAAAGGGGGSDLSSAESADRAPRLGLCAKVSDFGLSTMLSASNPDTHISATTAAGSLSHMSPELLLCGHVSKANDVYAYGVLLFELFTGERAWEGMPRALLPARVALEGWRPVFPPHTPAAYRQLAERCWQADPAKRPTFEDIMTVLKNMRDAAAEIQQEWVPVANPQVAFLQQLVQQQRRPTGTPA